jgi:hypothetical protein
VDSYIHNLKLKLLDKPYNHRFVKNFNFNEEEQAYLNSLFNLNHFLDTDTPLIHLMNKGHLVLVSHLLNFSKITQVSHSVETDVLRAKKNAAYKPC